MYCDEQNFRNYAGVEEREITATELQGPIDTGHLAEFESYEELAKYVGETHSEQDRPHRKGAGCSVEGSLDPRH